MHVIAFLQVSYLSINNKFKTVQVWSIFNHAARGVNFAYVLNLCMTPKRL